MDNTQKAELAEEIAKVVSERGLTYRAYESWDGSVCLLGAGRVAQGYDPNAVKGPYIDVITAKVLGFDNPGDVMVANDGVIERPEHPEHPALTKQEAIDLAMSAAKKWRNKG